MHRNERAQPGPFWVTSEPEPGTLLTDGLEL